MEGGTMLRFTIRELLILTMIAGLVAGWCADDSANAASEEPAKPVCFALDGYCPVTLVKARVWQRGDAKYHTIFDGLEYRFASASEERAFLDNPRRFAVAY